MNPSLQTVPLNSYQSKLFLAFQSEQKMRMWLTRLSWISSLGAGFGFLILLFSNGYLGDPSMAILMYWGLFTNLSSTLLIPYFSVPNLILELVLPNNSEEKVQRIELIKIHKERILLPFLRNRGYREDVTQEEIHETFLIEKFQLNNRFNWKRLGKIYFVFYSIITLICSFFFFQSEF